MPRTLAVALLAALGTSCIQFPSPLAYNALDYHLDRPRVLGIRLDPPVTVHGVPVEVDVLALGPGHTSVTSVDVCGLEDDTLSMVWGVDCFKNPDLVTHLSDTAPFTWNPPDLSDAPCVVEGWDTGTPPAPEDTGDAPYAAGPCVSLVPLLVTATTGDRTGYGDIVPLIRRDAYAGEELPPSVDDAARSLEVVGGEVVAGGEIALEFRIDTEPSYEGFRWYVDAGDLVRTGRTVQHDREGDSRITRNELRIPDDHHGPMRIVVVTGSAESGDTLVGDLTWSVLTVEVP